MRVMLEFFQFFLNDLTRWLSSSERLKDTRKDGAGFAHPAVRQVGSLDRKLVEMLVILFLVVPPVLYCVAAMARRVFGFWFAQYG